MNVLVVDDQISVRNGIRQKIDWEGIGITGVYTAADAAEARGILEMETIHIMLCDIEMPGEDGIALNAWVQERFPEVIRILLTSHTEFAYARESVRLGCFDYLVQPAPYDEITTIIERAVLTCHREQQAKAVYEKGRLYEAYEAEMLEHVIRNLYSANPESIRESVAALGRMGYHLEDTTAIRVILIDMFSYVDRSDPRYSYAANLQMLAECLRETGIEDAMDSLICTNRFYQYVILLASRGDSHERMPEDGIRRLYEALAGQFQFEPGMYVGNLTVFSEIRPAIAGIHAVWNNNVAKKPGIFHVEEEPEESSRADQLEEAIGRWRVMLAEGKSDALLSSIQAYLSFQISTNRVKFSDLCDMHQQLTQLFFQYAYNCKIDIMSLFGEEYTYNDYMDGYTDVNAFIRAVSYMTERLGSVQKNRESMSDVAWAKQYIREHVSETVTVKEVSDYVHRSPEYFTKVFRSEEGMNIKNYILQVKLKTAKDLLEFSDIPVSLVAAEIGYDNFSHFTQMFKKYEHMTPSEYRKQMKRKLALEGKDHAAP